MKTDLQDLQQGSWTYDGKPWEVDILSWRSQEHSKVRPADVWEGMLSCALPWRTDGHGSCDFRKQQFSHAE